MPTELLFEIWTNLTKGAFPQLGFWSYIIVAVLVAIEGSSITIMAALLASTGVLRPEGVFIAASVGNLLADTCWYLLGYLGRFEVLTQRIHWLQKHKGKLARLEQEMKRHAVKILLAAKLTLSMAIPALVAAGMARVRWRRWFPAVFVAECIKTGSLVFIGFHLGEYVKHLENWMQMMAITGIIIFIGAIIWSIKRISKTSQLDAV